MAKVNDELAKQAGIGKVDMALAKLEAAQILGKSVKGSFGQRPSLKQELIRSEAENLVREVVGLLAGAVGLRVSADTAAKLKPARKRARRQAANVAAPAPVSTTAKPPKRGGLPVAEPWENPNLPDAQEQRP